MNRLGELAYIPQLDEVTLQVEKDFALVGKLGVEFMANYYTPKNQSLNPLIRTERPYPIITVHDYLKRVIDAGIISPPADLEDITTDIRMIVIGNVFEWCLKSGDADFEGNMRRSLTTYLNGLF